MNSDDENGDRNSLKSLVAGEFGAASLYEIIGAPRDASPGYCLFTHLFIHSLTHLFTYLINNLLIVSIISFIYSFTYVHIYQRK